MKNILTIFKLQCSAFLIAFSFACHGQAGITVNSTLTWDAGNPPPSNYQFGISIIENGHVTIDGITLEMTNTSFILLNGIYSFGGASLTLINGAKISGISNATWGGIRCEGDGYIDEQFSTTGFPITRYKIV